MTQTVLAIDIGGTKVAVASVREGRVLAQEVAATPAAAGPDAVVEAVVACSARLLRGAEPPRRVGVACAGVVSEGRVRAMSPDLLPGWHGYPLVQRLVEGLSRGAAALRVVALNDAQAAAYGEHAYGAGRGRDSLLFVTVSTGVGGGLVLGGRLWRGATGLAGHVGHLRGGELESLASGTALARRAAAAGHPVDARAAIEAARSGEQWAAALLADAAAALARALADVRVLLDPEVVVLGGGVGLNPGFQAALASELELLPEAVRPQVVPAELGAAAGLVGAAAWAEAKPYTPA